MSDFTELVAAVRRFSEARSWTPVQTPKNLAMALCGEAGELAAELQWLSSEESVRLMASDPDLRRRVTMEMADVVIYLARLADVASVDLIAAAHEKLAINETRFPVGERLRVRAARPTLPPADAATPSPPGLGDHTDSFAEGSSVQLSAGSPASAAEGSLAQPSTGSPASAAEGSPAQLSTGSPASVAAPTRATTGSSAGAPTGPFVGAPTGRPAGSASESSTGSPHRSERPLGMSSHDVPEE